MRVGEPPSRLLRKALQAFYRYSEACILLHLYVKPAADPGLKEQSLRQACILVTEPYPRNRSSMGGLGQHMKWGKEYTNESECNNHFSGKGGEGGGGGVNEIT